MDIFGQIASKIIQEQEQIIGPLAVEQAQKVPGLVINWSAKEVTVQGDEKHTLEILVEQYEHLFGRASVEVCRDAVKSMLAKLPAGQVPAALQ